MHANGIDEADRDLLEELGPLWRIEEAPPASISQSTTAAAYTSARASSDFPAPREVLW